MTELSASDAAFSLRDKERLIYFQHADNGIAQRFSKSGLRTRLDFVFKAHSHHSDLRAWHTQHAHTTHARGRYEPVLQFFTDSFVRQSA